MEKTRICSSCKETKSTEHFYLRTGSTTLYRSRCKKCTVKKSMDWEKENPEKYKARWQRARFKKYGISEYEFEDLIELQHNKCAICRNAFSEIMSRSPHIDHCHDTGQVRGILCQGCNIGLGAFKDDIESLRKAIEYLTKYTT